jgi:polyvinyl alcohol dehydrogenase (cytochrome)
MTYWRLGMILLAAAAAARAQDGSAVYGKYCSRCHDANGLERMPPRAALAALAPERILHSLDEGVMRRLASGMSQQERRAVSEYIAGKPLSSGLFDPMAGKCQVEPVFDLSGPRWTGWGVDLANSRFQPDPGGGLSREEIPRLKLKWAYGFPGDINAFSQPTVAGERVFAGSQGGRVLALEASSGCVIWHFEAESSVRTAVLVTPDARAVFGDFRGIVYAVDAATGALVWKTQVDDHPYARVTGSPQFHAGRIYVPMASAEETIAADPEYPCCTFRGSVAALDAVTGRIIWKTWMVAGAPKPRKRSRARTQLHGPSGAGVWSSPTIDPARNALYVATGDNYSDPVTGMSDAIVALDLRGGKVLWHRQVTPNDAWNAACFGPDRSNCPESDGPDFDFGASPILVNLAGGKRALIAGQKSGLVHALDPDRRGRILWQARLGKGGKLGGIQWGPAAAEGLVFVGVSDQAIDAEGTKREGRITLDPRTGGGLFALDPATGRQIWATPAPGCGNRERCSPAQSAAVTAIPGVVFSGSVDGHLRAYASGDGRILWDFDTARPFVTVNGVAANGGSIDSAGPAVAGGMVFANSGYGQWGGMPGNVLLAFSPDGK